MKSSEWVCIAWPKKGERKPVCKQLILGAPVSEKEALLWFRTTWPGLRNYTVQPGRAKEAV